ncbi:MAG: uracil phosphoribosyltransferase [Gammaproteobacteria bacterium]|nr:MAG: uracil phosphoribosyltransferase [Gammaproteobacteria bacterium]
MGFKVLNNPLLVHLVNSLRPKSVKPFEFRATLKEIGKLSLPFLLEGFNLNPKRVLTWKGSYEFGFLEEEKIVILAVLRASLPMAEGMLEVLKNAIAGFVGAKRDEKTLKSYIYYRRYPTLEGKTVIIPDPMLATGSTMELVLEEVLKENPKRVITLHCVASPEGLKNVTDKFPQVEVYTIAIDQGLDENGFIGDLRAKTPQNRLRKQF